MRSGAVSDGLPGSGRFSSYSRSTSSSAQRIESGGHEKCAPQPDSAGEHAADHRPDRRPSRWAVCTVPIAAAIRSRGADSAAIDSVSRRSR